MTTQPALLEVHGAHPATGGVAPVQLPRLMYIDNLRTVLIIGVILGHLSVTYGLPAAWYYKEGGETSDLVTGLGLFLLVLGLGFAMGLFFLMAGYFTPAAYDRKGTGRFLLDRIKRLGLPLLLFEEVINPIVHYMVDVHGGDCTGSLYDCQFQGTFFQYLQEYPRLMKYSIGDGPVWTLMALLIFSLFYALWRLLVRRPLAGRAGEPTRERAGERATERAGERATERAPHSVPGNAAIAWFALAIGICTFIVRLWAKVLVFYEPLHLEFAHFPQYIALFIAGTQAYRGDWLTRFTDHQARLWRWVALGCVLVLPAMLIWFGALSGEVDERVTGGANLYSLVYSLWEGFLSVSMVVSLLAWFRRSYNRQGSLARLMSESTMAVYVLHPAIIVPFTLLLSDFRLQLNLKFLLVSPLAIALCYLVCAGLRRVPFARAVIG